MPKAPRVLYENAIYHVYSRGNCKKTIFKTERDFEIFLNICNKVREKFSFEIFSYCLMGNHYHFLIRTPDANLPDIMRLINQKYAIYFNETHEEIGYVFQGRYNAKLVEQEPYLIHLFAYINLNPYAAYMVQDPFEWQWSSASALRNLYSRYKFMNLSFPLSKVGGDFETFLERHKSCSRENLDHHEFCLKRQFVPLLNSHFENEVNNQVKVEYLLNHHNLKAKEISTILNIGRSTVYRVAEKVGGTKRSRT